MAMTYNSLVNEVLDYLNRADATVVANVPNFIYQAEQRIARESKTLGIESYVVSTFIPGTAVYPKPSLWRRNLSLNYGVGPNNNTRTQMYLRTYEFSLQRWPDRTQTAAPLYYSDYGYSNLLVFPTPDLAYPFEFCFLALPDPISIINQTNWLTNYAPDALLYGTLLEAVPFLKDDERVPVWQQYFDRALKSINDQDDQRVLDRASNRGAD